MCNINIQSSKLVTIGIPFFNADRYIDYAIKSVINQSYNNWELILTDDGSIDGSVTIAKKYLYDHRIRLITDGENKGLSFRLNQQIALANGKYFARMDADDIMHPERIQRQVEYLEANLNIDVIGSSAYSIDNNNNVCGLIKTNAFPNTIYDVFNHKCFIHPSVMARLHWYKNNLYDLRETRVEDIGLWSRTIMKSSFANLSTPLLFYRNVGLPTLKKYLQSMKELRKLYYNIFPKFLSMLKWKLILKTHLKSFVYTMFCIIKKENVLIKRRNSYIDDSETLKCIEILKGLKQ